MHNKIKLPDIESKPNSSSKHNRPHAVTAKAWLYWTPNYQYGFKTNMKREIASITKIMTALCTLEICEKFKINKKGAYFKVTEWAARTNGTTANLQNNAWMSIEDLLYGLMLPSGNDAAMVLAQNLGAVLFFDKTGQQSLISQIRSIDLSEDRDSVKYYMAEFVNLMNLKAHCLKMFKTKFSNPHGMDMINNYSCCDDVLLMAQEAMKDHYFRDIVKTKAYKGTFKYFNHGKVICKPVMWTNTNKLLSRNDIIGLKTGITNKAGGCLTTTFLTDDGQQGFIITLGCASMDDRFSDTVKILEWAKIECSQS